MLTAIVIFSLAPFHFNLNAAWPAPGMYKSQIVRAFRCTWWSSYSLSRLNRWTPRRLSLIPWYVKAGSRVRPRAIIVSAGAARDMRPSRTNVVSLLSARGTARSRTSPYISRAYLFQWTGHSELDVSCLRSMTSSHLVQCKASANSSIPPSSHIPCLCWWVISIGGCYCLAFIFRQPCAP